MRRPFREPTLYVGICLAWAVVARGGAEPNKPAEKPPAQGLLWQVESAPATVYLLGVIHVGNDRLYPLAPALEAAFARADVLVQETKIDSLSQRRLQKTIFEIGMYTPPENLEQHLGPETRAAYERYLQQAHVDPNTLKLFRPWVVAWMISMNEALQSGLKMIASGPVGGTIHPVGRLTGSFGARSPRSRPGVTNPGAEGGVARWRRSVRLPLGV